MQSYFNVRSSRDVGVAPTPTRLASVLKTLFTVHLK